MANRYPNEFYEVDEDIAFKVPCAKNLSETVSSLYLRFTLIYI